MNYRYYSTQRPIMPGSYPKPEGNGIVTVYNFDNKTYAEEVQREAFLEYAENHKGIQIGVTAIPVERLRPFPEHMNCKCSCDSEEPATEAEGIQ